MPVAMVKGAPEAVLPLCVCQHGAEASATFDRKAAETAATAAAEQGFRVLALAMRDLDEIDDRPAVDDIENELTFLGLVGMAEPPREGMKEALDLCRSAGIKVMMITGDHPATASAIAVRLGISDDGDKVPTSRRSTTKSAKRSYRIPPCSHARRPNRRSTS